jgi:hypothetical protein
VSNCAEKASAYRLDDAVNAACDFYEDVEGWKPILDALDGKAPRTKTGKLLRDVRDWAGRACKCSVEFQRRAVKAEMEVQ